MLEREPEQGHPQLPRRDVKATGGRPETANRPILPVVTGHGTWPRAGTRSKADVLNLQRAAGNRATTGALSGGDAAQTTPLAVQRVGPAVVALGLTLPELAGVVGTATGVAAAVGAGIQSAQGKSGVGPEMKLQFEGDYLMTAGGKAQLENIARVLFFQELDKLHPTGEEDAQDKRGTALGNVKQRLTATMDSSASVAVGTFYANGDGKRNDNYKPWGRVTMRAHMGVVAPSSFGDGIYDIAATHSVNIRGPRVSFIKSCIVSYDMQKAENLLMNDNIFVRGDSLNHHEDSGGSISLRCTVAFDWDADTTWLAWTDSYEIRPNHRAIFTPEWKGSRDPDD